MRNETKHRSRAPRGLAALRGRKLPRRSRAQLFSLAALLVATALLYLVGLSISGYANEFYSAAAQAGSTNWWSFLWGSSDAGNSITVDKPPAAIWPMALAVRLFGLSSWSILVPQAIMGVLAVWLLYATVRRQFGHRTGLLAGAALATTPVACLMFRFNNPDALLVLLLIACVHCVLRALEFEPTTGGNRCRTAWMALAGVACGFAFLTKQLQAFLILPGLAVAFLVASPTTVRRRLLDSAAAVGALVASAGWWVLLTVLVPASMRPYIGGSQTNSFLELTFGYNGLGRITGSMEGAVVAGGSGTGSTTISTGHAGMWGQTGITRLFDGVWGTQWSWLAPAALAGIVVALVCLARAPRTSVRRAQVVAWGGWLVVTGAVFSFMGGTIHQYYTVALGARHGGACGNLRLLPAKMQGPCLGARHVHRTDARTGRLVRGAASALGVDLGPKAARAWPRRRVRRAAGVPVAPRRKAGTRRDRRARRGREERDPRSRAIRRAAAPCRRKARGPQAPDGRRRTRACRGRRRPRELQPLHRRDGAHRLHRDGRPQRERRLLHGRRPRRASGRHGHHGRRRGHQRAPRQHAVRTQRRQR